MSLTCETSSTIRLTGEGESLLGRLWPVVESSEEEILQGFTEAEREQLRDYLGRLQANCVGVVEP